MENHRLVLPQHLNHHGKLFGGYLLAWVDEFAFLAASTEYPGVGFVTIGLEKAEFRHGVEMGTILTFRCNKARVGTTSVTYDVEVDNGEKVIFTNRISFVAIDEDGNKRAIPK